MTGLASLACATLLAAQSYAVVSPEVVRAHQELRPYFDLVRAYHAGP